MSDDPVVDGIVKKMYATEPDPHAPTMSIEEFVAREKEDPNMWWRLQSGDHQNLFEEACERLDSIIVLLAENDLDGFWFDQIRALALGTQKEAQ